ncbi:MAG: hypothetical protein EPO28_16030 [Saprospiraceae bacterium]|nr:MAG: hypothetical protein EPO28_16030 [Saprospiraceae bacterium]
MKYLVIFLVIFIFLNSCVKKECQIAGAYEFEIPVELAPARDTFQIGDTITITSDFLDEVYERKTDKTYRLDNLRFYPSTEIVKIDSTESISGINKYFEILLEDSLKYHYQEFSTGVQALVGQYNYSSNRYFLKFSIIAKNSGLFYLEQGVSPDIEEHQDFDGKCSNIAIGGAVVLNDGADNNIHMLSDSPDPHYNDWILQKPEQRFHKFGGYCFYVKE